MTHVPTPSQHEHPPHVLDTVIVVVMDASKMWTAAGCDVCIRKKLGCNDCHVDANIAKH